MKQQLTRRKINQELSKIYLNFGSNAKRKKENTYINAGRIPIEWTK